MFFTTKKEVFKIKNEKFSVGGMTCAACQANVTKSVSRLSGVEDVNVNLLQGNMTVEYNEDTVSSDDIVKAVVSAGYTASLFGTEKAEKGGFRGEWAARRKNAADAVAAMRKRLILSVVLLVPLMYVSMGHMLSLPLPEFVDNPISTAVLQILLAMPVMFINRKFYISGFKGLVKRAPNMDSLVAIGSAASFLYSLYSFFELVNHTLDGETVMSHNLYFESAAMILTLVTVGKYLETISKNKTSYALEKLVNLTPKTATVLRDGLEIVVPAEDIRVGDTVVIRPGDVIPVDGTVTDGKGFVDQSAVTGESLPVEKNIGDGVVCATKNKNGHFYFVADKVGEDTTLSQIIRLVDDASGSKAPIARIADKVSGVFVPAVMLIALVTAIVWLLLGKTAEFALTSAVSVLVISCPCALGLATPVAIMVGTGKAAGLGILIRSAESLENLHSVDTVVLDKTGTVTSGTPSVNDIVLIDNTVSKREFLKLCASLEQGSHHPYALAVLDKYGSNDFYRVDGFTDVAGRGVKGEIKGTLWCAGNKKFMEDEGIAIDTLIGDTAERLANEGKTVLFFSADGVLSGLIAVSDTVRPTSKGAISELHAMNIKTVILTGDNKATADAVKTEVGIDEVVAEVMPNQKEEYVRRLEESGHRCAMIGDGINDAPALARAFVGIAIGAGTDIAVETADIVLMKNSLYDAVNAIKLSRSVIRNIKLNLFWAFFYNVIGIPIAAGVFYSAFHLQLSPMLAAGAMSLSSLFVVGNALRLRKFKGISYQNEEIEVKKNMKTTLIIEGMMCQHCKANVEKTLLAVDGVENVTVSLEEKSAVVESKDTLDCSLLTSAVENAGYKVVSCK